MGPTPWERGQDCSSKRRRPLWGRWRRVRRASCSCACSSAIIQLCGESKFRQWQDGLFWPTLLADHSAFAVVTGGSGILHQCECRNASIRTRKYQSRRSSRSTLERRKSRDNKCATPGEWAGANQEREQSAFQLAKSRRRAAFSRLASRLGSTAWTLRPRSRLCFYRWLLVGIRSRVLSVLRLRQLSVR